MHEAVTRARGEVSGNVHERNVQGRCSLTWKREEHRLAWSCCRGLWFVLGSCWVGSRDLEEREELCVPQEPGIAAAAAVGVKQG